MTELTTAQLVDGFRELGLGSGDVVLVHSSYRSLGGVEGGPKTVVDALLECVGHLGTLIMPTFNFGFCRGEPFDVVHTASHMGVLTELVREAPQSRRVPHPIYSFAVIGARAEEAASIRESSSYGPGSLFASLVAWDAKIMIIGLTYNDSMTFFHHVEEIEGCNYRYLKEFSGTVIDESGAERTETALMYVRDLDKGVITAVDPMGELLEDGGLVATAQIGSATVRMMRARPVFDATAEEVRRGGKRLHRVVPPDEARRA